MLRAAVRRVSATVVRQAPAVRQARGPERGRAPEPADTSGHDATIRYLGRPYVCGVLGQWQDANVARLLAASPPNLRRFLSSDHAAAWATAAPETWRSGASTGYYWGPLATGTRPVSWRDVAEGWMAPGLQVDGDGVVLHADALGLQDVYVRRLGEALYFASHLEPLLDICDAPLHTDWESWANILAITSPLGDATPFVEIRRLSAATGYRARAGRVEPLSFEPSWLRCEPDDKIMPRDAFHVVAGSLKGVDRRVSIPLSGGWDSRLLAILASRRRLRRPVAWTTSKDDGRDRDIQFASTVAQALRLRHEVVVPGPEAWVEHVSQVRSRTGFQTTHHVWMMPLARILHGRREQLLDGLGGDVLFKSLFVSQEVVEAGSWQEARQLLCQRLQEDIAGTWELLNPAAAPVLQDLHRFSFEQAVRGFEGHHAAPTLAVLHTRTARAIASSPLWLFGPESRVAMPFVHPEVVACALRIPMASKLDGAFYRAMLDCADPRVGALPSTNTTRIRGRPGPRRKASQLALETMAQMVRDDDVAGRLLRPDVRAALDDPTSLADVGRLGKGWRALHWASMLGQWRARYRDRLADDAFPDRETAAAASPSRGTR